MSVTNNENILNNFDLHWLTSEYSKEFCIKWTFKGFSQLATEVEFKSPLFELVPACECILHFKKKIGNLCLYLENKSKQKITIDASISIFDYDGKRWHCESDTQDVAPNERKDLISTVGSIYKNLLLLKDDILIIICNFKITRMLTTKCLSTRSTFTLNKYNGRMKWCDDLKNLCNDQQYADITLKVDEVIIPVNKAVLGARSAVFRKMFLHSMDEQENGSVQIDDVPPTVLKKLVEFLNTGELDIERDFAAASALYYAADKYEVLDLRKMCADTLVSLITVDNATEIVVTANRHEDEYLKNQALVFLCDNANSIFESRTWNEFENAETKLAAQVLKYYVKRIGNKK